MLRPHAHRRSIAAAASAGLLLALAVAAPRPSLAANHAVSVNDGSFGPAAMTVAVGDTVTWTNRDDSLHTVTAEGGAFDSGNLEAGASFAFTFTEPGTYTYRCNYHEEMVATITVTAAPASAGTDAGAPAATGGPATDGASTGAVHGPTHQGDQPDTALPVPAGTPPWLPTLLIGLGLVGFAFALIPMREPRVVRSPRGDTGWRR
jgi:plastocyanin